MMIYVAAFGSHDLTLQAVHCFPIANPGCAHHPSRAQTLNVTASTLMLHYIKVRPAAAGRASIEEEEGGLGVEEGGPNAGRAGRAGGAGGAGGASGTLVVSG